MCGIACALIPLTLYYVILNDKHDVDVVAGAISAKLSAPVHPAPPCPVMSSP